VDFVNILLLLQICKLIAAGGICQGNKLKSIRIRAQVGEFIELGIMPTVVSQQA